MILLFHPFLQGQEITPLGPEGGDVRSLTVHPLQPGTFFLGTSDGQIFVSHDSGAGWSRVSPGLDRRDLVIDNLVFHPTDPDVLYAGTWELRSDRGRLFRTRDGGHTWAEISTGRYQSAIRAIAVAPSDPNILAVGISEGVILSLDEGATWDRITRGYRSLYSVESLAFDPVDARTLYVGTWHLGWKTTDLGKSWTAIHDGMVFDSDMFALIVNPEDPNVLYSSACTGVYKSTNAGVQWTKLKNGLPQEAQRTRTLHLDPARPDTLYSGTTLGLFVSHDAGASWTRTLEDVVVNAVASQLDDNRIILVGTDDAGVMRSVDGGATFTQSNRGFVHRQVTAVATLDGGAYYVGVSADGTFGGFFGARSPGRWESYNDGLGQAAAEMRAILPARLSRTVFLAAAKGVYVGTPFAKPWSLIEGTQDLTVSDLSFADPEEKVLLVASEQGLFTLDPAGRTLKQVPLAGYEGRILTVLYAPDGPRLLAGGDEGVFRSEDRGKTWSRKSRGLSAVPVNALEISGKRVFAGTQAGLFFSDNGGEDWGPAAGVHPIDIVAVRSGPGRRVVAADSVVGHLYYSDSGGERWDLLGSDPNGSRIAALALDSKGDLLAGTISDGVYLIRPTAESAADGR